MTERKIKRDSIEKEERDTLSIIEQIQETLNINNKKYEKDYSIFITSAIL